MTWCSGKPFRCPDLDPSPTLDFPGPHSLFQSYGDLAKVDISGDEQISLELGAYSAICYSHRFTGHLAVDGTTISGDFPPGPNQSPNAGVWIKRPGNTCVDAADLPKTPSQMRTIALSFCSERFVANPEPSPEKQILGPPKRMLRSG